MREFNITRKLKLFNGRGYGGREYLSIAAYSRADAARMLEKLYGLSTGQWERELRDYFGECWGNTMAGIEPKRGVWVTKEIGRDTPVLIYDGEDG